MGICGLESCGCEGYMGKPSYSLFIPTKAPGPYTVLHSVTSRYPLLNSDMTWQRNWMLLVQDFSRYLNKRRINQYIVLSRPLQSYTLSSIYWIVICAKPLNCAHMIDWDQNKSNPLNKIAQTWAMFSFDYFRNTCVHHWPNDPSHSCIFYVWILDQLECTDWLLQLHVMGWFLNHICVTSYYFEQKINANNDSSWNILQLNTRYYHLVWIIWGVIENHFDQIHEFAQSC